MSKQETDKPLSEEIRNNLLYERADELWSQGKLRDAFRHFLSAARAGVVPAFDVVAGFYDRGDGTKTNQKAALHWYNQAYRKDRNWLAANNIGCIWRDRNQLQRALLWLHRAVKLGDADANLNIAKIYLDRKRDPKKALPYLRATCKSRSATQGSREEARRLLRRIMRGKSDLPSKRRAGGRQASA